MRLFLATIIFAIGFFTGNAALCQEVFSGAVIFEHHDVQQRIPFSSAEKTHLLGVEIGTWSDDFIVELSGPSSLSKARQRQINCLSLPDEGPHIDLIDWKRQVSRWRFMERLPERRFQSAKFEDSDFDPFPPFTEQEILDEVKRISRADSDVNRWTPIAKSCAKSPELCIGGCFVEVQFSEGADEPFFTLTLQVPMGC